MKCYREVVDSVVWVAHTLYDKGYVNGLSGNISFLYDGCIYISKSGSCFGKLDEFSFVNITKGDDGIPSKEYPMHEMLYGKKGEGCIIHTHSLYTTLFSCEAKTADKIKELFLYTPYLEMLTGRNILCVDYAKPGSEKLFADFKEVVKDDTAMYILKNHGVIVWALQAEDAFNMICEIEASSKIRYMMNQCNKDEFSMRNGEK